MGFEVFAKLCEQNGVTANQVAKATGVSSATITSWKKGEYKPKIDKLQKIADYFGVSISFLNSGDVRDGYYLDPKTAKASQEVFDDKNLQLLFKAARGARPEYIKMAARLLEDMKRTNPDG